MGILALCLYKSGWIQSFFALADFKMKLWRIDMAAGSHSSNRLPTFDNIAFFYQIFIHMGIRRHKAIGMTQQNHITITLNLVSAINHNPLICGTDRVSTRGLDIDSVIVQPVRFGAKSRYNPSVNRFQKPLATGHHRNR